MDIPTVPLTRRSQLGAAALVFLGALCFSAKAVIVKLAYRYGVDSVSLLTLRMAIALPFFMLTAMLARRPEQEDRQLTRRDWAGVVLMGVFGYYLASFLDFFGLQYISASMERLILFAYPTLVLLISAVFFGKPISRAQYAALVLTYLGILIAFSKNLGSSDYPHFWLGAGAIFLGALAYAIYLVGSGNYLPRLGTWRYTSYAMMAACLAVIVHHGLAYRWQLFTFPAAVYWLSLLMALISTVLPAFLISEGIRRIGAGNAAIIGSVGPISTIILAYIFLGERLVFIQWVGAFLVIGGVLVISLKKPVTTK